MEPVSHEELIGLYFDGVATAEEHQAAVRLLEQSAQARAWLADLEQMRSALAALPRQTIPVDCTSAVLRRAQQEMLIGGNSTPRLERGAPEPPTVVSNRQIWVALAVAAAALIVVVLPNVLSRLNPIGEVALLGEKQGAADPPATAESPPGESATMPVDGTRRINEFAESSTAAPSATQPTQLAAPAIRAEGDSLRADGEALGASRKLTAPSKAGAAVELGDEVAKDGRSFGYVPPGGSGPAPMESVSYVYNVPTAEAQRAVLKKFEATLREEEILLESDLAAEGEELYGKLNEKLQQKPPSPAGGSLGGQGLGGGGFDRRGFGGGAAAGIPALQSNQQIERSLDCVYVVEATQLQLSNTISKLDDFTAPAPESNRARRMTPNADESLVRQQRGELAEQSGKLQREKASGEQAQAGQTANPASSNLQNPQYRSQALRLATDFDDSTKYEAAREPAQSADQPAAAPGQRAVAPAKKPAERPSAESGASRSTTPAPSTATPPATQPAAPLPTGAGTGLRDRWGSMQQRRGNQEGEPLQRAVIIFRVVPGAEAPAASAPQQQP
jgi:hypothetical protein